MRISELTTELRSENPLTRVLACGGAGARGDWSLIPVLKRFVTNSKSKESEDVCVAIRSIGQLIRRFSGFVSNQDLETSFDFLLSELRCAQGVYCSSVVFSLILAGSRYTNAQTHDAVADAVVRVEESLIEQDKAQLAAYMRYRGYQYAVLADPRLLDYPPWNRFIPPPDQILKWDTKVIEKDYF